MTKELKLNFSDEKNIVQDNRLKRGNNEQHGHVENGEGHSLFASHANNSASYAG